MSTPALREADISRREGKGIPAEARRYSASAAAGRKG